MVSHSAELVRLHLAFEGLTVLLVDDDVVFRDALRCMLEGLGATVLLASDGIDALAVLREHDPALVLSDITMPRLDGYGLVRHVREDPARSGLAMVAVSASLPDADHPAAIRGKGIDGILGKPFDYRDLDRVVQRLMVKRPQIFRRQRMGLRARATAERARARGLRAKAGLLRGAAKRGKAGEAHEAAA
jgi:CheY-like chemotaxis protein